LEKEEGRKKQTVDTHEFEGTVEAREGAESIWLSMLGTTFQLDLTPFSGANASRIESLWNRCATEPDYEKGVLLTSRIEGNDDSEILAGLTSELTYRAIEFAKGSKQVLIHASGIANETGQVTGFIGQSGAGKTSVARSLGKKYQYVTDETLAVDPSDGSVMAFPKPLSLVAEKGPKVQMSPDELGLLNLSTSLTLGSLYFLNRVQGLSSFQIETLPWREWLERLIPQVSFLDQMDRPLKSLFDLVNSHGGIKLVSYSEAEQLNPLIQINAQVPPFAGPPQVSELDLQGLYSENRDGGNNLVWALPPNDALLVEGQLVALHDGNLTVLEPLATEIWISAHIPISPESLLDHLKREFPAEGISDERLSEQLMGLLQELKELRLVDFDLGS
jgi:hypothetical protein